MVFLRQSVLQHILRRVPLRHRLCNCALVSRSWAEAASEATQTLSIQLQLSSHAYHYLQYWSVPVAVRCLPWLLKHSSQLTSLKVQGFHRGYQPLQTTLELRSLVQLSLQGVNLQLSHGDQRGLFWHDCTGLTSLILHEVQVSEGLGVLAEITRLTSLKSLTLTRVLPMDNDGECIPGSMPGSMLQLPELNQLQITANAQMSDDSLRLLSTLTKLQHLVVEDYSGMLTAAGFTGLAALAECPRLLHLQVAIRCVQHADLLGTLPPLMHELTHLSLQQRCHMAMRSWEGVGAPAMDYFDVLTADSSSLQYLALDTFVLDHEAWHSMFPADRLLDKLTHLDARLCCSTAEHPHCVLDENDLLSMAACCPNLCHLNLLDRCDPDIHLGQVLQQLSDLTALHFTATDGDAAAALVVHSLPSLKELCLKVPDEMSDAGWRHLASLRHLAHLWVNDGETHAFHSSVSADSDPMQTSICVRMGMMAQGLAWSIAIQTSGQPQ